MAYNILVVDDSSPMRAVIKKVIKASGFNIGHMLEAGNGNEAIEVLNSHWLDLVLTDYNMPHMDGLGLLQHMKGNELMKDIPVVMVTTEGSDQRVVDFMAHGATAYIKKPFSPEQIKKELNRILGEPENGPFCDDDSDESCDF